jgi:hypothetical protein
MGEYALDPNTVYEFDENGTPRNPNDSQSLIDQEQPQDTAIPQNMFMGVPIVEQRPESIQPENLTPALNTPSRMITNRPELQEQAIDTGGGYIGDKGVINYKDTRKGEVLLKPDPIEKQLEKIEKLTPEQLTTIFEGKYKVSLSKASEEQALEQIRSEAPAAFRKRFGYDISRATGADLAAFLTDRDKVMKGLTKIYSERQRLAIEERKEYSADNIKKLKEENRQLDQMLKATKPPAPKMEPFMDENGKYVGRLDVNNPETNVITSKNNLKPYEKPVKPENPEYKPGQAMKRMSAINSAIVRLKSGSPFDALIAANLPEYAGSGTSVDPAIRQQAVDQLTKELDYLKQFAPAGAASKEQTPPTATIDQYGYVTGEQRDVKGKKYQYIGNNKWKKL